MQPQDQLVFHDWHDPRAHLGRPQLVLGLAVEYGILELHGDRADDAVPHVLAREALVRELVHALQEPLAEGALVGSAVLRVLAVDEAVVGLAVAVGVGDRKLEAVEAAVDRIVERRIVADLLFQQVGEPPFALEPPAAIDEREPGVQVRVVVEAVGDELLAPGERIEDLAIGREANVGSGSGGGVLAALVRDEPAALELRRAVLPVPPARDLEVAREGVDRLGADAVQPHGELEDVVVVLPAGVDLADAVDELAQGNAAPEVPDRDRVAVPPDLHPLAAVHDELVDGVVDHLLQHRVDAVQGVAAVAEATDVHTAAQADVLQRIQRLDRLLVVRDPGARHEPLSPTSGGRDAAESPHVQAGGEISRRSRAF